MRTISRIYCHNELAAKIKKALEEKGLKPTERFTMTNGFHATEISVPVHGRKETNAAFDVFEGANFKFQKGVR